MKQYHVVNNLPMPKYFILLMLIPIGFILGCNRSVNKNEIENSQISENDSNRVSWNILFKPGTDAAIRNKVVDNILDYATNYYAVKDHMLKFDPIIWCPCDSLLYNISFSPIQGAGSSVIPPPPSKPGPAGSGNYLDVANIADNLPIFETMRQDSFSHITDAIVQNKGIDSSKKLAIIDSGIDTSLFTRQIRNLLWSDPFTFTLYNFLPYQPVTDFSDETTEKHGSAVAAVAIKAMEEGALYPKLMILKALNKKNTGNIFSVSCALSYAIQKQATVINLSLGYYGEPDSILFHYLTLCNSASPSIQVFAAAGNTKGTHHASDICKVKNNNNELIPGTRLFYPACFTTLNNITSVTQINKPGVPCFYQNYSDMFINLGVYDKTNCCAIRVGFSSSNPNYFEGSSFATPVVSGLKMMTILKRPNNPAIWESLIESDPQHKVTIKGKYIRYSPNFP